VKAGGAAVLMTAAALLPSHEDEDSKKEMLNTTGDGKVILAFSCWLEGSKLFRGTAGDGGCSVTRLRMV
jgi:hypothetical protein